MQVGAHEKNNNNNNIWLTGTLVDILLTWMHESLKIGAWARVGGKQKKLS